MSVKANVFRALGDRLIAKLKDSETLPDLKWYDKDCGQAQLMQDGIIALPMPAALFTITTPEWSTAFGGVQHGKSVVRVRILFENYADAFQTQEGDSINQDKALQCFDFEEAVHTALQGFAGDNFTALCRISDTEDDDHNNVIVTDLFYETLITDASGSNTDTVIKEDANPLPQFTPPADMQDYTSNDFIIPS